MASGGYSSKTGMNENQKRFADTYLANGYNATQAYSSVFPKASYNTCRNNAYALLRKPAVAEYVAARRKEIYDSLAIDAEHIAQKLAEIAFATKDDKDYVVQYQLQALDLLQKQLGVQNQKVSVDADVTSTLQIVDDYGSSEDN